MALIACEACGSYFVTDGTDGARLAPCPHCHGPTRGASTGEIRAGVMEDIGPSSPSRENSSRPARP
jgi:hypothetical protein